jgi:hypothetical protein
LALFSPDFSLNLQILLTLRVPHIFLFWVLQALKPLGIGVATGEMCCNRVMFKQFLQAGAMQFCQIDSCRIGGVNEVLSVYFMAKKLGGLYLFV